MSEIQFLRLNEKWALACDSLQWILQKRRGFDHRRQQWNWQNVAFVHFSKDVLLRFIREKEVAMTAKAQQMLDALPATFPEFLRHSQPILVSTEPLDAPGKQVAVPEEDRTLSGSPSGSLEVIVGGRSDHAAPRIASKQGSCAIQQDGAVATGGR